MKHFPTVLYVLSLTWLMLGVVNRGRAGAGVGLGLGLGFGALFGATGSAVPMAVANACPPFPPWAMTPVSDFVTVVSRVVDKAPAC